VRFRLSLPENGKVDQLLQESLDIWYAVVVNYNSSYATPCQVKYSHDFAGSSYLEKQGG